MRTGLGNLGFGMGKRYKCPGGSRTITMKGKISLIVLVLAVSVLMSSTLLSTNSARAVTESVIAARADFVISANPTQLTIAVTNTGTSNVAVTSVNGFSGTVALTATVFPLLSNGPVATLSPTSASVSPGGSGSSVLTVSTTTLTPNGDYTVTVTGTKGSVSDSTTVQVVVVGGTVGAQSVPVNSLSLSMPLLSLIVAGLAGIAISAVAVRRRFGTRL